MSRKNRSVTAADVRARIENVRAWAKHKVLLKVLQDNPSLRGIVMGYFAEEAFEKNVLRKTPGITKIGKDDDHKKTKSDRTFIHRGRRYTIQLKSIQTNSIKEVEGGSLKATVQNDASDRRPVKLPNGKVVETTCYKVGEYDVMAVPLYPFTGSWLAFAYKRNKDLKRSRSKKYRPGDRKFLLATSEEITWPLDGTWETELRSSLNRRRPRF